MRQKDAGFMRIFLQFRSFRFQVLLPHFRQEDFFFVPVFLADKPVFPGMAFDVRGRLLREVSPDRFIQISGDQ